ncbi:MAG: hypothetical protein HYS21_01725 [Deltaproteobacteria bacterium]|nr:hypothetical protein [Deltaproteobacteria bacterium]
MSNFWYVILALGGTIAAGFGSTYIFSYFNRHLLKVVKKAEELVRKRLQSRDKMNIKDIVAAADIEEELLPKAHFLLNGVANSIGVDPENFRPDDMLGEALFVSESELSSALPEEWSKTKIKDGIQVFSYEILNNIEKFSNKSKLKTRLGALPNAPKGRADVLALISSMSLKEFLKFFSPIIDTSKMKGGWG